ncbi:MAG: hypothetical protein H0W88_05500 [Parachlamydiaceae bacterium]|nr:hypothetical protein [Parachlamydiaceae bacterium]
MQWQIIESDQMAPQAIMQKDADLLNSLSFESQPILHLYEWNCKCLTYGHFIDPAKYLEMDKLRVHHLEMARRPTGGGIIFHLTDFAFSILLPINYPQISINTLDNYAYINRLVAKAIEPLMNLSKPPELLSQIHPCTSSECNSFCMAQPTKYDIIIGNKKVGGAAQRRTKKGLLHQGSLSLAFPPRALLQDILLKESKVLEAMQEHTFVMNEEGTHESLAEMRLNMKDALKNTILQIDSL